MPSTTTPPDSPPPISTQDCDENTSLQPFFLLHNPLPKKSGRKHPEATKVTTLSSRRRIDLSAPGVEEDHHSPVVQEEAFNLVWSNIEITINQVLRDINTNMFDEIHTWICEAFTAIRSSTSPPLTSSQIHRPYPLITDVDCRKVYAGIVLTRNVELVDDLLTFKHLNLHLKSKGCHVVNLSSLEIAPKNGVGACITSLLRQLIGLKSSDVADITILASWYSEPENFGKPLVVIIDDMDRCNGSVLSDFILLLTEWVVKLPVILVMGVATTVDALRILLPANTLNHLQPCKFALGSPAERMSAIVEAVFLNTDSAFHIGHKVAVFLRNYFLRQDGTVTSFIKALKIACAKHFTEEPLSFLCKGLLDKDYQGFLIDECASLSESLLEYASNLPSCQCTDAPVTGEGLASGLSHIMKLKKNWCSVLLCLYEAAKFQNVQLLDILCEALDPALYCSRASPGLQSRRDHGKSSSAVYSNATKGSLILQVIRKVRDFPVKQLHKLLQIWTKHSEEITEVHEKLKELHHMFKFEDESNNLQPDLTSSSEMSAPRNYRNTQKDRGKVNEKAALLMECMVRDYLKPIECVPFHEIVCFKHVDKLQSALIGDPRRMIQVDLLKSHNFLHCSCCSKSGNTLSASMHDTSIMYALAQEQGDLINLHDWFQSFKSAIRRPSTNAKCMVQSPSSKKRKHSNEPEDTNNGLVQARFCRAVMELQITGLLRMPSKRRPDYVQRVAFGL